MYPQWLGRLVSRSRTFPVIILFLVSAGGYVYVTSGWGTLTCFGAGVTWQSWWRCFFWTPKRSKAAENVIINVSICQSVAKIVKFNGDSTTHICHQSTFCTTPKLTYRRNLMVEMVPLQGEHVSFEVCIVLVVVWYRPFNALSPPFTGATKKHRKLPSSSDTILISMENRGFLEFDLCLVGCKSRCSRHLSFSHRDGREPQTCCAVGDVYWSHWRPGKIAGNWWLVERCGFFSLNIFRP